MDYTKFLGKKETRTLPHFGGAIVDAPDRTLRLDAPLDPGWWQLEIKGRKATAIDRADPDPTLLETLPTVRGHLLGDRLFREGAIAEPIFFLPADEPPRFSLVRARRWSNGNLIFESIDFDTEAEENARRLLEDERSLRDQRGIPATLRAAFGFAVADGVARRLGIPLSFAEIAGRIVEIAEREDGRAIARAELERIDRERAEHERWMAQRRRVELAREQATRAASEASGDGCEGFARAGPVDRAQQLAPDRREPELRAEEALASAGAQLLDSRRLDGGLLEVTYRFMGERFLTIVQRDTLRVVDAGICLAGYDDRVTLESLPGVIREAIEEHRLVIARRDARDPMHRYHWEHDMVDDPEDA